MTTTPEGAAPDDQQGDDAADVVATPDGRGAEIGITEGEGSSFEPEEDPAGEQ